MDCDWDSEEEETELFSSSLHIPINAEAKKVYDEWIEKECDDRWWDKKEQLRKERIETPTQKQPCYSDIVRDILALEDEELLEDFFNQDWESFFRRLKID